jgi:DNA-binding MarR family transcriptional regulator
MIGIITQQGANLTQLSKYLDVDDATLSRGLGTLQKAGLVREIDLGNRNKTYQLTPQGQRAVHAAAPHWEKALKRFQEQLAPTDWHDVVNRLQTVGAALKADRVKTNA